MELLALPALPLLLLTAAVAASTLLLFAAWLRKSRRYHPVVGSIFDELRHFRQFYRYHTELSRHHKSYRIRIAPFHIDVHTNDPAVVKYILGTNFHNYNKGTRNSELMKDLLSDGIFAVDGSKWRHQRKLASYEFTTRSLREHIGAVFKKNAGKLAAAMSEAASSDQAVEMQNLFYKIVHRHSMRGGVRNEAVLFGRLQRREQEVCDGCGRRESVDQSALFEPLLEAHEVLQHRHGSGPQREHQSGRRPHLQGDPLQDRQDVKQPGKRVRRGERGHLVEVEREYLRDII